LGAHQKTSIIKVTEQRKILFKRIFERDLRNSPFNVIISKDIFASLITKHEKDAEANYVRSRC